MDSYYKKFYQKEVTPAMMDRFKYKNVMQVPKLDKVSLNMGVGGATQNAKLLDDAIEEMTIIAGQRAVITRAKKSVAAFKIRTGMPIGCKVTLRAHRMYEFFNRLVSISLPRIRDFRGLSPNSFDGRGNYSLGIQEQVIFPEINYDKVSQIRGMDITIATSAKSDEEARELLRLMGIPFRE